jgi:hypothetical protein
MKIRPVTATVLHFYRRADEQTNKTKLIAPFGNFADVPKNIHDFQIYRRKYLNVISLPSLREYHYNGREHHIQWQFIQYHYN